MYSITLSILEKKMQTTLTHRTHPPPFQPHPIPNLPQFLTSHHECSRCNGLRGTPQHNVSLDGRLPCRVPLCVIARTRLVDAAGLSAAKKKTTTNSRQPRLA